MKRRIMSHLVVSFPDLPTSKDIAKALVDGGSSMLEVQFPFSDPTADGVYIQRACKQALQQGFRVDIGFEFLSEIRKMTNIPVFAMSYGNLAVVAGVRKFLQRCKDVGVQGVIVPDLPPDYDEGIFSAGSDMGLEVVPVIAPSITDERLRLFAETSGSFLYTPLRRGITGEMTNLGDENMQFLSKVKSTGKKILAGFGIRAPEQVAALSPHVHACVAGSVFIHEILNRGDKTVYKVVHRKIQELAG